MTANKVVLLLFSGLAAACSAVAGSAAIATDNQPVVMTDRGPIKGTVTPTLRKFLGIPYAAPPLGDLRWRPPQTHARWLTPIDATKFGNHCP
jgi:para-nitrobenzyl esterase